ncbi:hypothetical protein ZOSMA_89G00550 [Zostera marina]|uniref:WW domain-containing protein n=1 Tax=Zostera marina TaxID=29655 RepID=A0A0K9NM11_ZOSMR|nr:hypothetical protein ZOSMA_89G00550 [Zostera marina]
MSFFSVLPYPDMNINDCSYRSYAQPPCIHMQEYPGVLLPEDCTVDLNSEVPLLYPWQQFLNIQTGKIYYVNRNDGSKTNQDPRRHSFISGIYEENENENVRKEDGKRRRSSSSSSISSYGSNGNFFNTTTTTYTAASSSSTVSSASSTARSSTHRRHRRRDNQVLVLVGCKVCLTLSMVCGPGMACGKCGSVVVCHF